MLASSMTPGQACAAIAHACLQQITANVPGVIAGQDPEFVHQMRVALRRLRSALKIFRACLPSEVTPALKAELQWLAGLLGRLRDWDVLTGETLPRVMRSPTVGRAGKAERDLGEQIAPRRAGCALAVCRALRSRRFRLLIKLLGSVITELEQPRPATGKRKTTSNDDLRGFAIHQLKRAQKKLHVSPREVATMAAPERHAFRIAAKRLRYAVDFFSSLFSGKSVQRYTQDLAALQDALGMLNDQSVAAARLDDLQGTERAMASTRRKLSEHDVYWLGEAVKAHRRLLRQSGFWRKQA